MTDFGIIGKFLIILILNLIITIKIINCLDLEICLGQYDIHRNMIIRTEESLAIGGKYLQGIALDTEPECRRLCCETENCDVFVFEEKSEAYCYLFSCGPPENFRCKFTKHANFTSAVLTPVITTTMTTTTSKPVPIQPVQLHPVISQQEMELKNLKTTKLDVAKIEKLVTTTLPSVAVITTLKTTPPAVISNCGRFQFKCHSGECIGIYNACNGIPQCEDGSDEGPECTMNNQPNVVANRIAADRLMYKPNNIGGIPRQYPPQIMQSINNREDPMSAPLPIWPNRQIPDFQTNLGTNVQGNLQISRGNNIAKQQPNIYSNIPNPYRVKPEDHLMLPANMNWDPQAMQQLQQQIMPMNNIQYENIPHQEVVQQTIPTPITIISKTQKQDIPEKNIKDRTSKENSEEYVETSVEFTEAPKKKQRKHKKQQKEPKSKLNTSQDFVYKNANPYEEYRMEFKDRDGYSEKPSGAIISLVLGILITAFLAILIGCKMRTVGRRRIRVKGSFNDADFLVNGMYL